MFSEHYYIPEHLFFFAFYTVWGMILGRVAPVPCKLTKSSAYYYYMYYTNLVSFVHWIIGIIAPSIIFYYYGFETNRKALYVHHLVMWNCTAYFIYDFIMELAYEILDTKTALHHISIFVLGIFYSDFYY